MSAENCACHKRLLTQDFLFAIPRLSIPVKPGGRLTVEAEYGSIAVEPADVQAIQVEVYRKVEAPTREENERILKDFDLQVTQAGNDVTLRGVFKEGWRPSSEVSGHQRRICQDNRCLAYAEYLRTHHYKIAVPREFTVDLATRAGSIGVGDLKGEARARTSGGSLSFGRIAGPVWGRTSGGSVHIGEVSGQVVAHTSGGHVTAFLAAHPQGLRQSGNDDLRAHPAPENGETDGCPPVDTPFPTCSSLTYGRSCPGSPRPLIPAGGPRARRDPHPPPRKDPRLRGI